MRIADDFDAIRTKIIDLQKPKIDPATCSEHFFKNNMRCIHCNIHYYHLPAILKK